MITLIGGEMLLFSDLDGTHGPAPAGGPSLRALTDRAHGRVLVAGPHDPALIPAGEVTVLVRGLADAETLAERRPDLTVCCGSLEKMAAVAAYDTIIALDGLDRLISAEAADRSAGETHDLLTALLRPGGQLLLGAENTFGLHRMAALPPALTDADWVLPVERRPSGNRVHAAYFDPKAPAVLLGPAVLAEPSLAGFVAAALSAAAPDGDFLADPVRLATGALRHGLATDLAPAWIIRTGPTDDLPAAVIDGREFRIAELPRGRTLADLLVTAGRRRDLPVMRDLLTAWLDGPAAGVPADQVVVGADGVHTGLAPAGPPLVALRRLATTLIHGGEASLWPAPADEAELTAVLAAMTGREVTPAEIPAAGAAPDRPGLRELIADRDRLARELAEARAKHQWYEQMLTSRETELKKANAVLAASAPARAVLGGWRASRRAVRAVVRRTRG